MTLNRTVDKLVNFFRRSPEGGFLFCACDIYSVSRAVTMRTIKMGADAGLLIRDLPLSDDDIDIFHTLIIDAALERPAGLIVSRFDELIRKAGTVVVNRINSARDLLLEMRIPLLFWLSTANVSLFANQAPDIFSRRARSVIDFTELAAADLQELAEIIQEEALTLESTIAGLLRQSDILLAPEMEKTMARLRAKQEAIRRDASLLIGSGAMAVGAGAVAAGAEGIAIRGNVHGDVIMPGGRKTVTRGADKEDDAESMRGYLRVLFSTSCNLPLRGRDLGASDPESCGRLMNLASVYIALKTTEMLKGGKGADEEQRLMRDDDRRIDLLSTVLNNRRLVILGDPGAGKSTFLNHLTLCLAGQAVDAAGRWLEHLPNWPEHEKELMPVPVILRDFGRWLPDRPGKAEPRHLLDFMEYRLAAMGLQTAFSPLRKALETGRAIMLFDGLDEVADPDRMSFVRDAVAAFASRFQRCRMIVSCRVLTYRETAAIPDFPVFTIAPFDRGMIRDFIRAWYNELARTGELAAADAEAMTRKLTLAVEDRAELKNLAANPLLLTVMTLVHTHQGRLPEARARLYEEAVDVLMWRWDQIKAAGEETVPRLQKLLLGAGRTEMDLKRVLWQLAYDAHREANEHEAGGNADIKEWQLVKAVSALHPGASLDWARQIISVIKHRAGLLVERLPGVYSFPHRTFQEYLAGAHLASRDDFPALAAQLARQGAIWREVILLAVGRLVFVNGDTAKPLTLASELAPARKSSASTARALLLLAGEVLVEFGPNRCQDTLLGKDLLTRVMSRLKSDMRLIKASPIERTRAGRVLARLGDPRKGVGLDRHGLPDIGWVEIDAGPFVMGSDKKRDPHALNDEQPQGQYIIPYDYRLSRYPVTNAQFQAFVKAGGYRVDRYWAAAIRAGFWNEEGFKGRIDESIRSWPHESGEPFNLANHPVVGVTWYEALAFCAWLTERLHEAGRLDKARIITLPNEPEWEKAARGGDGRIYPWGNKADPNQANYHDTGIGSTNAVGCFSSGVSPYGVEEMSGNVWEWTRSLWGKSWKKPDYGYPYRHDDGREEQGAPAEVLRVLRGGSFYNDDRGVRCACRFRRYPNFGFRDVGFRVVSPSILTTLHPGPSEL